MAQWSMIILFVISNWSVTSIQKVCGSFHQVGTCSVTWKWNFQTPKIVRTSSFMNRKIILISEFMKANGWIFHTKSQDSHIWRCVKKSGDVTLTPHFIFLSYASYWVQRISKSWLSIYVLTLHNFEIKQHWNQ